MADELTLEQLKSYQVLIDTGRLDEFYKIMRDHGYGYAGWALGVALEDTSAGVAAVAYMTDTAMMGPCGEGCTALTSAGMAGMKHSFAVTYLETLIENAGKTGEISSDITAQQAWDFHEQVYKAHGLAIENWTLHTPFQLIYNQALRETGSEEQAEEHLEKLWQEIIATEGSGLDAVGINIKIYDKMTRAANGVDGVVVEEMKMAHKWLGDVSILYTGFRTVSLFMGDAPTAEENARIAQLLYLKPSDVRASGLYASALYGGATLNATGCLFGLMLTSLIQDDQFTESQVANIIQISTKITSQDYAERCIDSIGKAILGSSYEPVVAGDYSDFSSKTFEIINNPDLNQKFHIWSLIGDYAEPQNIAGLAQINDSTGLAIRYALSELSPVAILGADYSGYDHLELYDESTGAGFLTESYIRDRAAMLQAFIKEPLQNLDTLPAM